MKIVKYLFILVLLVFIGGAIYFGTKDGTYKIDASATINVHPELVYKKVNNLKSWESWSPWRKEKPEDIFTVAENFSDAGASASWEGIEKGSVETLKTIPYTEIKQLWIDYNTTSNRTSQMEWQFESLDNKTQITWTITGEHSLMDKVYLTLKKSSFNKSIYTKMKDALERLDNEIAKDIEAYSIHVDGVTHYGGGYYMYVTSAGQKSETRNLMTSMFDNVSDFMTQNRIRKSGSPFILYNENDPESNTIIFSAAIPIRERVITPEMSRIVSGFMEPVTAVKTTLKGHYKNIAEAYQEAEKYLEANHYTIDTERNIFEVYASQPEEVVNPADWITEIYIPIVSDENDREQRSIREGNERYRSESTE